MEILDPTRNLIGIKQFFSLGLSKGQFPQKSQIVSQTRPPELEAVTGYVQLCNFISYPVLC